MSESSTKSLPGAFALMLAVGAVDATELSDPTRPMRTVVPVATQETPVEPTEWRLSMVRTGVDAASAVLNGTLVHVGDAIGAARVESIANASVVLEQSGQRTVVALAGEPLKRPAGAARRTR